ncbi:hypothetical protein AB5I41_01250 [Sphingomonas sp. MMS24-JH45]
MQQDTLQKPDPDDRLDPPPVGRVPSLDPMIALVTGDMNAVNAVILDRMQSQIPLIPSSPGT